MPFLEPSRITKSAAIAKKKAKDLARKRERARIDKAMSFPPRKKEPKRKKPKPPASAKIRKLNPFATLSEMFEKQNKRKQK